MEKVPNRTLQLPETGALFQTPETRPDCVPRTSTCRRAPRSLGRDPARGARPSWRPGRAPARPDRAPRPDLRFRGPAKSLALRVHVDSISIIVTPPRDSPCPTTRDPPRHSTMSFAASSLMGASLRQVAAQVRRGGGWGGGAAAARGAEYAPPAAGGVHTPYNSPHSRPPLPHARATAAQGRGGARHRDLRTRAPCGRARAAGSAAWRRRLRSAGGLAHREALVARRAILPARRPARRPSPARRPVGALCTIHGSWAPAINIPRAQRRRRGVWDGAPGRCGGPIGVDGAQRAAAAARPRAPEGGAARAHGPWRAE